MVPKIIARGRSFKGAAAYLLHDKGHALTAERVAWTNTRNLAVENPDHAWRIMAATALDQDRLKEAAGIKATGRKSDRAVLHLSLSWHPDEKDVLTEAEMKRAARGALRALGADDRQALIIAHNDEAHPHVHILCNRVSPDDGRMLSSSKEKLALSSWAEAYEKERGTILCEERVLNNEARDAGIYTRGEKPKSRQEMEERQQLGVASNDNYERVAAFFREQRAQDALLADERRKMTHRHRDGWERLRENKTARLAQIEKTRAQALGRAEHELNERAKTLRTDLHRVQQRERQAFDARECKILGRVQNAFQLLHLPPYVRGEEQGKPLTRAFDLLASSGARKRALERQHEAQRRRILKTLKEQHRDLRKRLGRIAEAGRARVDRHLVEASSSLRLTQAADRAAYKAKRAHRSTERREVFAAFMRAHEKAIETERAFTKASTGSDAKLKAARVQKAQQLIKAKLEQDRSRGDRDR